MSLTKNRNWDRRSLLAAMGAGGLFFTQKGAFAQALVTTPSATEGPYYPDNLPLDQDNDLLVINDSITPAVGSVAWLSGRILDRRGDPIRGALIEIWQSDDQGNYIHSQGINRGTVRDTNFQGYGRFLTGSSGEYLFRTIKPGLYPGRARHVHARIIRPDKTSLTTQLFVEGETGNDGILNGIAAAQRPAVVKAWTTIAGSAVGALAVNWDIVMDYTPTDAPTPSKPTLVSMAGVTHGATIHEGVPAGSWVTLFGDALSTTTRTWNDSDIVGGKLPESLDGVSVRIDNQAASVYYISPKQINVLAPEATADGNVQVTVTNAAGTSDAVTVAMKRIMPGFFQFPSEYVAAVRSDGALIGPANLITGAATVPAKPGDAVLLFGTGFGTATTSVKIHIHDTGVPVAFAGIISPGLHQINITVPDLTDGDYPVTAEVNGVRTAKFARIRIQKQTTANAVRTPAAAEPYAALLAQIRAAVTA
ncbi:MAG: IPT/TIG domain-containing protein [Bryobacteraceae bacterium]